MDIEEIKPVSGKVGSMRGYDSTVYLDARNSAVGSDTLTTLLRVGQNKVGESFSVYRSFLTFDTSVLSDTLSISGAILVLEIKNDTNNEFTLHLVEGTFSGNIATDWLNDFVGWAESGTYSVTDLSNTIDSTGYVVGDRLFFIFNTDGIDVIDRTGDTTLTLLSSKDITPQAPTSLEYFNLDIDKAYLQIIYTDTVIGSAPPMVVGKGVHILS